MKTVNGKYNSALIYTDVVDDTSIEQVQLLCDQPFTEGSKIRMMPDIHAGAGCTIGTTMTLTDKIVPNLVGVDIGCFTKDTRIHLADNRDISFEEMIYECESGIEHYGYSINNNGRIVISKLDLPRKIKTVDRLVIVELDNGNIIKCTEDHIFYDINRNEIEAKDLKEGTSLFPLYIDIARNHKDNIEVHDIKGKFKSSHDEYHIVYQPSYHIWSLCHYLADEYNERSEKNLLNGSFFRHHIDFNKYNNNPTNIQRVTYKEHWKIHADNVSKTNNIGTTGFKAAIKKHPTLPSVAGKLRAESTWKGSNAEKNRSDFSNRMKDLYKKGVLGTIEQRECSRQRQLLNNTNTFSIQNKDKDFILSQKLSKLRKILELCNNDFSEESYNKARKHIYNAYTYIKACEIAKLAKMSFEEIVGYKNHKVVSVRFINEHTDVYCLTNFEYGNFALSAGVFVHNCGMLAIQLEETQIDYQKLDNIIHEHIPYGRNIRETKHEFVKDIPMEELKCIREVNDRRAELSVGSLGGGNHFIEIDRDENNKLWLVIHSGSRNLGLQVAKYYQELAFDTLNHVSIQDLREMIERMKANGERNKIQKEIQKLKNKIKSDIPKDLAYLQGGNYNDYLHDMKIMQIYADKNRQAMADIIIKQMNLNVADAFTTTHNYIDIEHKILRKGAVSARLNETLIIPINMRDGSLICRGKGNDDWNQSAPHGAGRLFSRKQAKQHFSLSEFTESMKGIYTTSVNEETLDECPMVYKRIEDIVDNISPTVDVIQTIKPEYNFKASE